jgi:hypothetical protein
MMLVNPLARRGLQLVCQAGELSNPFGQSC